MAHGEADGEQHAQPGDQEQGNLPQPPVEGPGRAGCGVVGHRLAAERAPNEYERDRHNEPAGDQFGSAPGEHEIVPEESGEPVNAGQVRSPACRTDRQGWAGAHRHGGVRPRQRAARRERPPRRWC